MSLRGMKNAKRRRNVLTKLRKRRDKAAVVQAAGAKATAEWTGKHDRESHDVDELARINRVKGFVANELLPDEIAANHSELLEDCGKRLKRVQQNDRDHANK